MDGLSDKQFVEMLGLLGRLDERTKAIQSDIADIRDDSRELKESHEVKFDKIDDDIKALRSSIKTDYVSKDQFDPVRKIVFGVVGIILTTVVGALVALVVVRP